MEVVKKIDAALKLDSKTEELAYIAILASARLEIGISFHVKHTKELGATRDEIISAVLVGLPVVGNVVISLLPVTLRSFDED